MDAFVPPADQDRFVINLGANDGARHDPSFPLIVERGYGGILIEGDPSFKKRLFNNVRPFNASGRLHVSWGFASPTSIGPRLLGLGSPRSPDALKIDVDGLDAALLEGILLAGIKPKAIVIEVNPDIPPPIRMSQLYHDNFKFEFWRKHMRGWLGVSADALFTMLVEQSGYALVAIELGTREHMVCTSVGKKARMCKKKGTCTHCENNMWFVRADLLKASTSLEPPSWPQFVNAFWKQTFAFNTFAGNKEPFPHQAVAHDGWFTRADEERDFMPECYSLSDLQFYPAQPGESFSKPACPLQALRGAVDTATGPGGAALTTVAKGWRTWARLSVVLAKPVHSASAAAYATSIAQSFKGPACRPDEACPFNATATVHARLGRGLGRRA